MCLCVRACVRVPANWLGHAPWAHGIPHGPSWGPMARWGMALYGPYGALLGPIGPISEYKSGYKFVYKFVYTSGYLYLVLAELCATSCKERFRLEVAGELSMPTYHRHTLVGIACAQLQ